MAAAQAAGRAGRVIELRDSLTQHLRGEPLHALDRELALWMLNLVERRVQSGTVDVEVAGWVARALDSFGAMPEAEPLRVALPALHRRGIMREMRAARSRPGSPLLRLPARGRGVRYDPRFPCSIVLDWGAFMSLRVRCSSCRTAFLTPIDQPDATVECPKCGAHHCLPQSAEPVDTPQPQAPLRWQAHRPPRSLWPRASRRLGHPAAAGLLALPGLRLSYWLAWRPWCSGRGSSRARSIRSSVSLRSTCNRSSRAMKPPSAGWSTIEEPPAIRSFQEIHRDRSRNRTVKGSFAPLARIHSRIESEFTYDPAIGRFTPKNPLGAAGETLDAVHAAKEKAEKSGIYEKMASGDPNDVFDAAENFGKIFTQLAEGGSLPRRSCRPTSCSSTTPSRPFPPRKRNWPLTSPTIRRRGTYC